MATFKCQKPGSCPLSKNGKTTQNTNVEIKKLQIHQSGQTRSWCKGSCDRFMRVPWKTVSCAFHETPSFRGKFDWVRIYAPEKNVYIIGLPLFYDYSIYNYLFVKYTDSICRMFSSSLDNNMIHTNERGEYEILDGISSYVFRAIMVCGVLLVFVHCHKPSIYCMWVRTSLMLNYSN